MHFAPLLLIVACELLLLLIELFVPLPSWLHVAVSITVATVLLAFVAMRKTRQSDEMLGLRRELYGMKQKAAKSARRYKSLLEGAGNAIFIFNAETGVLEEENRVGRELLGYSSKELKAMPARDLLHPSEHERFRSLVYQLRRQGRTETVDLQFRKKDGSLFLGEVNARLINLGDEQVAHCVLRDITEKRRAEREIWQRNRELSILNGILTDMNHCADPEGAQDKTLAEIVELFGAGGGSVHLCAPGQAPRLCASRKISPRLSQAVAGCIAATPVRFRQVFVLEPRDGDTLSRAAAAEGWGCVAAIPIGAPDHLIGVMHLMHPERCRYTPEELRFLETVGRQMGQIIDKNRLIAELRWQSEELLRSHRLLEKSSHNLSVSEIRLKQNLALVEQANLEHQRLDRMKNQFLGMVSHEFNTPLTSIVSGVDHLLQHGWSSRESACAILEMVREGGMRLKGLVADLLKLIRLEARRASIDARAVHLESLLEELVGQIRPHLDRRGQSVTLTGLAELPYFDADRSCLEQIFGELLENAIRFGPENGEIAISAKVVERSALLERKETLERFNPDFLRHCGERCFLEVEVRDAGAGIPAEEQRRIFEIFYEIGEIRHHTSGGREQGRGAGLGLAIVKGMVEAHGGMVWVESSGGSSFFLVIPLEQEAIQPELF